MHENRGFNRRNKLEIIAKAQLAVFMNLPRRQVHFRMDSFVKWFIAACLLVLILYKYGTRKLNYWTKLGVKQLKPIPIFGDSLWGALRVHDPLQDSQYFYEPFKKHRFGGLYMNDQPFLSVTDPELIKLIMVKDADHFVNRHDWSFGNDPLLTNNLLSLKDEKWRKMRAVMTTVFTSAKMKDMFGFMDKCARQSVEYLEANVLNDRSGNEPYEMECRDFFSCYGTDVIASTAFGLEVDSFRNPENEFYNSGIAVRKLFSGLHLLKVILMSMSPYLSKKFGFSILGDSYTKFFTSLVTDTIREREEKNIVRKDVIHILMEARRGKGVTENGDLVKGKLPDLTDTDIAAQALFFFFGGFDTMATLLGFISYELAVHPDIQENLQREIDEVIEKENGITYDGVLHQMQYLNMVVNEGLRKWPPAVMTDRSVSKPYTIPKTDVSPELVLKRGDGIWISIAALHRDPEYFPNPEKFDPERFRDEKSTLKPFTYLPFGDGIRHCIGMRYAIMETKAILVHMLRKFTFVPSKKTLIPMKLSKKRPMALEPENGFWLGVTPRN